MNILIIIIVIPIMGRMTPTPIKMILNIGSTNAHQKIRSKTESAGIHVSHIKIPQNTSPIPDAIIRQDKEIKIIIFEEVVCFFFSSFSTKVTGVGDIGIEVLCSVYVVICSDCELFCPFGSFNPYPIPPAKINNNEMIMLI